MWIYVQRTGDLRRNGALVGRGYSGHDMGKNRPESDHVPSVGPIPRGGWDIGPLIEHTESHGPYVMVLHPKQGTDTHGRSGFLIHGDNVSAPGTASLGCIILARPIREAVWTSGDRDLEVVAEDPVDGWSDAGAGRVA